MARVTSTTERPSRSNAVTTTGFADAVVVEHCTEPRPDRVRSLGELVGKHSIVSMPATASAIGLASRSWPVVLTRA